MPRRILRLAILFAFILPAAAVPLLAQGAAGTSPVRMAVVDMDRVMSESLMGKSEQANIDKLRADKSEQIANKQKEIDDQEEQIRNASLSWSAEKRDEHLRRFETMRIELKRLNEDATRDVQAAFNKSLAKLQGVALRITGKLGAEQGYTLILEKGSLPVLYASDDIDVTSEVIARMDQEARARSGAAAPPGGGSGGQR